SILFLFRSASVRTLVRVAIATYLLQILFVALLALSLWMGTVAAPDEMAKEAVKATEQAAAARAIFETGTFSETIVQRFSDWGNVITFGFLIQGFGAFSFFLFGFAAVRSDLIAVPSAQIWKRFRRQALPIGLGISAIGAWFMVHGTGVMDPSMMGGMVLILIGSPFSTAGYLGLLAKWADGPPSPIKVFFARGGTASLTAYLMQGLLLSLAFNGYGLGLFGTLGAAACIGLALGVALFTIAFASLWRTQFERGPLEVILRRWTYLGAR
ncbi:MAG: DUF418 domain-containing protein, partial [Pseudomonadota bacterium]